MEDVNSSTESTVEQTSAVDTNQNPRPAVDRRLLGHRLRVNWPCAGEKKLWQMVNSNLTLTLKQLWGTVEKKLERMGDIIYQYGAKRFRIAKRC